MKFMDEFQGSIGERCTVAGYGDEHGYEGSIEALHNASETVDVRFDNGSLIRVGIGVVTLLGDEDDA